LSPSAYVAQLQTKGTISDRDGRTETVGGYPAWVGRLAVPSQQQQATVNLDAAFIQKDNRLFEILGQSKQAAGANQAQVFAAMRWFRTLSDPARLNVAPDRVHVAAAPSTGSFSSIVQRLGSRGADVEDDAILNNLQAGDVVRAGTLIKYIVRGR